MRKQIDKKVKEACSPRSGYAVRRVFDSSQGRQYQLYIIPW